MLIARVVLPAVATLIPDTHAQDSCEPDTVAGRLNIGPAPPAVLTAHPSSEKAAMMAAMDLMKKSQRILRGWIMTRGNWTVLSASEEAALSRGEVQRPPRTSRGNCIGSEENRGRRTGPKDKVSDHSVARGTHAGRNGVGVIAERWPDSFEHDVHARSANVRVDTPESALPVAPSCALLLH